MSKKRKSGNPRKRQPKTYFSCWEYREDKTSEYKTILSLFDDYEAMFLSFPYENKFGHRGKDLSFIPNNSEIQVDGFGFLSFGRTECGRDYVGFTFLYGGMITRKIPSYWEGDKVKVLTKKLPHDDVRTDLEAFCSLTET
jgi:hypothetical protein